ncbi:MAG: CRISPR-associated endonuclease Cas2 [Patescibacteria group bacterium]
MGQESANRKRTKKNELQRLILKTVQVAGIIGVALIAPNVVGAMAKLGLIPSARQSEIVERASQRLVRTGRLQWKDSRLRLTQKGERQLRILELRQFSFPKPRKWDNKWRVLVFDIPEKRKALRKKLREVLGMIGFQRLQDSVWVYPHDCEDVIQLLKADFSVGDDVRYMIVDSIERDGELRRQFGLK